MLWTREIRGQARLVSCICIMSSSSVLSCRSHSTPSPIARKVNKSLNSSLMLHGSNIIISDAVSFPWTSLCPANVLSIRENLPCWRSRADQAAKGALTSTKRQTAPGVQPRPPATTTTTTTFGPSDTPANCNAVVANTSLIKFKHDGIHPTWQK